uniref:Putative basic tail protein n=1 Tax=Ixodes ricinus TaxID=34613 RepID=A0A0K8R3M4_IXORI
MGLTGTALVLVSLAFLRKRCSPWLTKKRKRRTRQSEKKKRRKARRTFYSWNDGTQSYDQFFLGTVKKCFYNTGEKGLCQKRRMPFERRCRYSLKTMMKRLRRPTKKAESRRRRKPKESLKKPKEQVKRRNF